MNLSVPLNEKHIVLHSCCAPCSAAVITRLLEEKIKPTVIFYNPNIHPKDEYERRKAEQIRFAQKKGVRFVDCDYDTQYWFEETKGLEHERERGKRCFACFLIRLKYCARFTSQHGFKVFTSTFGLSRWKDLEQVNEAGRLAAQQFPDTVYWGHNWRKEGGSEQMYLISKAEEFYQQEYCGCIYSLRDAESRRAAHGKPSIKSEGPKHYSQ